MVIVIGILSAVVGIGVGILIFWLCSHEKEAETVVRKEFYDDGGLKSSCLYFGSVKDGTENIYYPGGQLNVTRNWNKGVLDGDFAVNYSDGQLYIHGSYHKGELQGTYTVYDIDGNIKEQKNY